MLNIICMEQICLKTFLFCERNFSFKKNTSFPLHKELMKNSLCVLINKSFTPQDYHIAVSYQTITPFVLYVAAKQLWLALYTELKI